jgi:hypothetical protein
MENGDTNRDSSSTNGSEHASSKPHTSTINEQTPRQMPSSSSTSTASPIGTDATLAQTLRSLSLVDNAPGTMFRLLASAFHASQTHEGQIILEPIGDSDVWTVFRQADEAESRGERDVATLRYVRGILDQMSSTGSQLLLPALRAMADASRERKYSYSCSVAWRLTHTKASWRLPFGKGGILDFALENVASNTASSEIQIQSLRLTGNCCADTGTRQRRIRKRD